MKSFVPEDVAKELLWLQLMQHHGARTRLLDWTSLPLIALYFAVSENPSCDAVVWMLELGGCSDRMNDKRIATNIPFHLLKMQPVTLGGPDRPPAAVRSELRISREQADANAQEHKKRFGGRLVFFPCVIPNQRMSSQQGWFSCPIVLEEDHGVAIAASLSLDKFKDRWWCQRIVIKAQAKSSIMRALWRMNITAETLYCGLDGLGRTMSELVDLLKPDTCDFGFENGLLRVSAQRL